MLMNDSPSLYQSIGLAKNTQMNQLNDKSHFARSPSKKLGSGHEAQHLYLQGIRSLLQFVPGRFDDKQIKEVLICLIEVSVAKYILLRIVCAEYFLSQSPVFDI